MRIIVTGGAGFIGSHVVDRYLELGHEVMVIDDLTTGKREYVHPDAVFFHMDILDPRIERIFKDFKPDVVSHHAAQISVIKSTQDPIYDAQINILGSLRIIQYCLKYDVQRFIFISTGGALYGNPQTLPCKEEHPAHPLSPYGVAKLSVEKYLYAYHINYGFPYVVLRYGNVYGPRQDPYGEAGVVAIFTERMLRNQPVQIFGDGTQERDFVYVEDVVEANVLALDAPIHNTEPTGPVYNIGTGKGTSVNEIFEGLKAITGYEQAPQMKPPRPGEVYKIYLDATKIEREWGWKARISLREGLQRTVTWFQKNLNPSAVTTPTRRA